MAFSLTQDLKGITRQMQATLGDLGAVKSPEMVAAGKVVRRSIVKVLSVRGGGVVAQGVRFTGGRILRGRVRARGGVRSRPGEPPRRETGVLAQSVKAGPVGAAIRVGPLHFTALFFEAGVPGRLARRPFLDRAIEAVKDDIGDVFASVAAKRIGAP